MGTKRRYTPEFRRDAAFIVIDRGDTVAQTARDLGVGQALLGRWVKQEKERRQAACSGQATSSELRAENARLRRENERLRMENEFLGKASALDAAKRRNESVSN